MHDPLSVAFRIPNPFAARYGWGKKWSDRPPLVTIWHRDPETDGSDDSCDWFCNKRPLREDEKAIIEALEIAATIFENPPHYLPEHDFSEGVDLNDPPKIRDETITTPEFRAYQRIEKAVRAWRYRKRRRLHPRWHIWHWHIQVHPVQNFKRWAFSRCTRCGGRFSWGYAPVSGGWHGTGPLWFRSEKGVRHHSCTHPDSPQAVKADA